MYDGKVVLEISLFSLWTSQSVELSLMVKTNMEFLVLEFVYNLKTTFFYTILLSNRNEKKVKFKISHFLDNGKNETKRGKMES